MENEEESPVREKRGKPDWELIEVFKELKIGDI